MIAVCLTGVSGFVEAVAGVVVGDVLAICIVVFARKYRG